MRLLRDSRAQPSRMRRCRLRIDASGQQPSFCLTPGKGGIHSLFETLEFRDQLLVP
jgi:hypothetical protein